MEQRVLGELQNNHVEVGTVPPQVDTALEVDIALEVDTAPELDTAPVEVGNAPLDKNPLALQSVLARQKVERTSALAPLQLLVHCQHVSPVRWRGIGRRWLLGVTLV